jgi:ATP-binding cassette subfamily F protein uup
MTELTARVRVLEAKLADPALFARDRAGFQAAAADLDATKAALAAAEEQWLELEIRREELEASGRE